MKMYFFRGEKMSNNDDIIINNIDENNIDNLI